MHLVDINFICNKVPIMLDGLVSLGLTGKDSCFSDCLGQRDLNPLCELKIGAASCDAGFVLCQ